MSSEEDSCKLTLQDKAMKPADAVKMKELKSDKVDDCQKSPSRFARYAPFSAA